jgi:exopolysaccharide biosynthesis polyprenyl glycosylphosphotransferase
VSGESSSLADARVPVARRAFPRELDPAATRLVAPAIESDTPAGRLRTRGWLLRRTLVVADVLGLAVAFVTTEILPASNHGVSVSIKLAVFAVSLPTWILMAMVYGLYSRDEERADHSTADDVAGIYHLVTVGTWLLVVGTWLIGLRYLQVGRIAIFWAAAVACVSSARALARVLCRRRGAYVQNTIIVGTRDLGETVAQRARDHPEYGLRVVGFVDKTADGRPNRFDTEALAPLEQLPALCERFGVERIIFALPDLTEAEALGVIRSIAARGVQIDVVPHLHEVISPRASMHTLAGLSLIGLPLARLSRSSLVLKRALDIVVSVSALLILAPAFALVALLIRLESRGQAFYRQQRVGQDGALFRIVKFRTMVADADARKQELAHLNKHARDPLDALMFKIDHDPRVTRVGRLLRRHYLDELPQLLNVARGEMSLVGPRPLVPDEDRCVGEWGRTRLSLKPGMTGLWQVLGGPAISFKEMVKLDYRYVTSWSLGGDLRLLARTVPLVFGGGGGSY